MSSTAGPSRVRRPRRSREATSNGSTASSTGTADGARIGVSSAILISGDCEVMALYLGSEGAERKGLEPFHRRPGEPTGPAIAGPMAGSGTHNRERQL